MDDPDHVGKVYTGHDVYFEKQVRCRCGLHAINNALGRKEIYFWDIDRHNLIGNYSIEQVVNVCDKRLHRHFLPVFFGPGVPRQTPDESKDNYLYRVGRHAFDAIKTEYRYICRRRDHYFALVPCPTDPDVLVMADSTKACLFYFERSLPIPLGRLLKDVTVYVL